jgi:hypothetical protein
MATTVPPSGSASGNPTLNPFAVIRARAVLMGFALCPFVLYAVTNQAISHIFSIVTSPISAMLVVILLNFFIRKIAPKAAFSQTDLVVIFSIVMVAATAGGETSHFPHSSVYVYPFYARTNPQFKDFFIAHMPDWLVIKDLAQVKHFEGGGLTWRDVIRDLPLYAGRWGMYGLLWFGICFSCLCINSLMRGAWCERERLTFPLIQLPVAMCEGGGASGMWKSRYMWTAFIVMFSIDILNGFHYLYPNIPEIPVKDLFYIDRALREPPWSNIGDFRVSIYPFMAAIGLFMPSDMLLSFVVFFLLRKATHVVLAANGIPQWTFSGTGIAPGPPFFDEQTWGAVLALFLGAWWAGRDYLKEVWRDIKSGSKPKDGGVPHRWAFVGLVLFFTTVVSFGVIGGNLPVLYMIPYYLLFLMFIVVMTRVRAQLGPPTHEFAFFGSNAIMHRFLGTRWIGDKQATFLAQAFLYMNRMYRVHPMPSQLEAMKMGQLERLNQKKIFVGIVLASILGFFLAYFFIQVGVYRTGRFGWMDAPQYLSNIVNNRRGPDIVGITMTIFGFVVVMVLDIIRFRFPGFPLHPAGYFLSLNFGVDYYWFGMLVALLVKNFVQRYYGLKGYDKLRMVALGILVGEYAAETIWMTMALITKQSTYTISFNDRGLGAQ